MNIDPLPDEADFVFFTEPLPDDGLHCVAIAVEGMGTCPFHLFHRASQRQLGSPARTSF